MLGNYTIDACAPPIHPPRINRNRPLPVAEKRSGHTSKWNVLAVKSTWKNEDIDWWRAKHGKAEGERRFYDRFGDSPDEVTEHPGNMVLANGVAALWAYALGLGTSTANTALQGATYFTNANVYLGVGDGGITSGSGTVTVNNGSPTFTFSSAQSGLQGKYVVVTGDSTNGFYEDDTASGTTHTMESDYGGSNASGASWSYLNAESHSQTGLQGSTNTYLQAADSGFPTNAYSAQLNAITGATNADPIVLTISGGDINTNDIVQTYEVKGNAGANGIAVANPASSSSVTLLNTSGTGSYTYGGYVTKRGVFVVQATFGSTSANFSNPWLEWSIYNGSSTNKIALNRKVANLGSKSGGTVALKVGIAIG